MSLLDRHHTDEPQPDQPQPEDASALPQSVDGQLDDAPVRPSSVDAIVTEAPQPVPVKRPLYPRLLHLQHIHPNAWQRAVLGEGAVGLAVLLVLADLATAWTLVVLPLAVAAVVKGHDLLAGLLGSDEEPGDL